MLETKGAGFHHVMPRMDFDEGQKRLESHGYSIAFSGNMPGGERFAIFDTRKGNGAYVELMDLTPATFGPMTKIHAAHVEWDGKTEPKRDFFSLVHPSFV
jgi:hypothetical protein